MTYEILDSITKLPPGLWDKKVAKDNICLSEAFIRNIELLHSDDSFIYFLIKRSNEITGISFFYEKKLPLFPVESKRKKISHIMNTFMSVKIIMTGTYETYGKHYWFDHNYFTEDSFFSYIHTELNANQKYHVIIYRDFIENVSVKNNAFFLRNRFTQIDIPSLSLLNLETHKCKDLSEYLYSLKKKHRNFYKKVLQQKETYNIKIEVITDFEALIDELYPLYLDVNKRAEEYSSEPLSKNFFRLLNQNMKEQCHFLTLRNNDNEIIGFALLIESETELIPFLMGMKSIPEINIWHHLSLSSIDYALNKQKEQVDFGLTNSHMKKRLGADVYKMWMHGRFKNPIINLVFGKLLPTLIK